jgi:hypothetical protein
MALQTKPNRIPNLPRKKSRRAATRDVAGVRGRAIPQKVLLHAARNAEPPAISDDVPDRMPFPTNGR